jgi:beta-lactamase regulating signal transducer with metallopeptidase domain
VPASIVGSLARDELHSILAHETGHVARGDHFVRWLECLVCVLLWWNPLAWWARKILRICEEICCDAYVLAKTASRPDAYAGALVNAMEMLARPPVYPGVPASRINGGIIERRIRMILSGQSLNQTPRWVRGLVLAGAVLALPFGCTLAQEQDELEQPEPQDRALWVGFDGEIPGPEIQERLDARMQEVEYAMPGACLLPAALFTTGDQVRRSQPLAGRSG